MGDVIIDELLVSGADWERVAQQGMACKNRDFVAQEIWFAEPPEGGNRKPPLTFPCPQSKAKHAWKLIVKKCEIGTGNFDENS